MDCGRNELKDTMEASAKAWDIVGDRQPYKDLGSPSCPSADFTTG